ncbi:MAG: hypothetical protein E7508_03290 [Ruminococcus sp.]|nr:hypothetical protein [Ruminococcus sp.]
MIADIPYYPTLEAKIAEKGYAKKDIAKELGISHRSLTSKLSGSVDFWWKEVEVLCKLFSDISPFELFSHAEDTETS